MNFYKPFALLLVFGLVFQTTAAAQQTTPPADKRDEMSAELKENAFTMVENSIGQMNDYITSGIKVDEFYGGGSVEAEELPFNTMNKQVLMYIPNFFDLIKKLGRADFERTVALANKFERPEIRLYVRLRIVRALLLPDSEIDEKEKKEREQLVSDDMH